MTIAIDTMSEIELIELNHKIVQRIKYLRHKRTLSRMIEFKIGEKVRFHPKGHGLVSGVITKFNKKTVTVITDNGEHWNVAPVYLIKQVEHETTTDYGSNVIPLRFKTKEQHT